MFHADSVMIKGCSVGSQRRRFKKAWSQICSKASQSSTDRKKYPWKKKKKKIEWSEFLTSRESNVLHESRVSPISPAKMLTESVLNRRFDLHVGSPAADLAVAHIVFPA